MPPTTPKFGLTIRAKLLLLSGILLLAMLGTNLFMRSHLLAGGGHDHERQDGECQHGHDSQDTRRLSNLFSRHQNILLDGGPGPGARVPPEPQSPEV